MKHICEIIEKREADQFVLGPVLIADVVDRQGDIISAREVQLAAWRFAANGWETNVNHKGDTLEPDEALVVESFVINPDETGAFSLAGKSYKTTVWMMGVLLGDNLWQKVQNGELNAFSIEGTSTVEEIEEMEDMAA